MTIYHNRSINTIQSEKQESCVSYISNHIHPNEDHTIRTKAQHGIDQLSKF